MFFVGGGRGGGGGSKWRGGSRVPGDKKAQNRFCGSTCCIPLHAATATECDKKTKAECWLLKF